ncbi:hypothetical protein Chor_013840 [Crotalus horridus]
MNPILWEWRPVPGALLSGARILRLQSSARPLNTANTTYGTRGGGPGSGRTLAVMFVEYIWKLDLGEKKCEKSESWQKPVFLSHLKLKRGQCFIC